MAQAQLEPKSNTLELRFKRWTAVAVVCFLGLLAALPFRSTPSNTGPTVAPSHRERSLRFRAEESTKSTLPSQPEYRTSLETPREKPQARPKPKISQAIHQIQTAPIENIAKGLPQDPEPSHTAVARQGENLMDIAERVLGDRRKWKTLMELNPTHRSAFDELEEGAEITLPDDR